LNDNEAFPSLTNSEKIDKPKETMSWQSTIKEQSEKDEEKQNTCINEQDGKYWRGAKWIGPTLIRQTPSTTQNMKLPCHTQCSCIIIPNKGIEYSRDNITWHKTWNDTFSEEQLYNMEQEEEYVYQERCIKILDEYRERCEKESDLYYAETGELDYFALRELERQEYEEYEKQFEVNWSDDDDDDDNENTDNGQDDLEDDY
jgi:hypothetical protein